MRITGGQLGGRVLKVPRAGLRPTQDLVRGSLFSMLGERVVGAKFLDLYAGTGAVGIEAWSRGAAWVCWVEFHPVALRALDENVRVLGVDRCRVLRGDVLKVLSRGLTEAPYDVIFADPPYGEVVPGGTRRGEPAAGAALQKVLDLVTAGRMLVPGGWLIMEQGAYEAPVERPGWLLVRDRRYGGSRLRILEWSEADANGDLRGDL